MSWARGEVSHIQHCIVSGSTTQYPGLTVLIGIYAPGYEERRAQRIKEAYGIDVNQSKSLS